MQTTLRGIMSFCIRLSSASINSSLELMEADESRMRKDVFGCLPNLLAGACLQVRCPVWRLQLTKEHSTRAPHKRARHTRATQRSTTHTHGYTREINITAAIEMGGGREAAASASLWLLSYQAPVYNPCVCVCVCVCCALLCGARACCVLLCGARVLCSFVSCKRHTVPYLQASPQPRD